MEGGSNLPGLVACILPNFGRFWQTTWVSWNEPVRHAPGSRTAPVISAQHRLLPRNCKNLLFFTRKLINYFEKSHERHEPVHAAVLSCYFDKNNTKLLKSGNLVYTNITWMPLKLVKKYISYLIIFKTEKSKAKHIIMVVSLIIWSSISWFL